MADASSAATTTRAPAAPRRGRSKLEWREISWGLGFLTPWFIGLACFTLLPIIATLYLSFTNYNMVQPDQIRFVGLSNYVRMFGDPLVLQSLGVTVKFALIAVPLGLIVPLLFAVLVNSKHLIAPNIFRTLFFMPTIIPVVASVMVFQGVLNAQSGWINLALQSLFGIEGPRWLNDEKWVLPALNLLGLWGVGNSMLILLAALQSVPTELYEAAIMDGANAVQRFFRITVPMISPVIFYNVTLGVILSFQYFVVALLIGGRNGDPNGATLFYNLHLYRTGFVFNEMGYASTLAWTLFVIVMVLTVLLFTIGQRFVYYASPDR
jgi:multiple sugar transport system permease protein